MLKTPISADSHVVEHPDTFVKRIDRKYRSIAPHLVHDEKRGDIFVVEGTTTPIPLSLVSAAGKPPEELSPSGGFVTIQYGGWDMHSNVLRSMNIRGPVVDHAVATFVDDVYQRGLNERILLVITGEFGRTPKINRNAGRDHWAPLSTLALAGGGLKMGQAVGESDAKVYRPQTEPITPQNLMATIFEVLGIDRSIQFLNQGGRPVSVIETGKPIQELV